MRIYYQIPNCSPILSMTWQSTDSGGRRTTSESLRGERGSISTKLESGFIFKQALKRSSRILTEKIERIGKRGGDCLMIKTGPAPVLMRMPFRRLPPSRD